MARFRVETVLDPVSGKYFNELYYPETATSPIAVSPAVFDTKQAAEAGAVRAIQNAIPDQPVKVVPPPNP